MIGKDLNFRLNFKDQIDRLYEVMTSTQIKEAFDSRGEDLKTFIYKIIDILNSTTANSGARNIGFNGDEGIKASNVQDAIELLKKDVIKMTLGEIPDGTINDEKLSEAKGQIKDRLLNTIKALETTSELLGEVKKAFEDNKENVSKSINGIETVLKDKASIDGVNLLLGELSKLPTKDKTNVVNSITELFQSASNSIQSVSNGKNAIAGVVGNVSASNSFQDIAGYIANKRNEIGGYLGAGDYGNLQRLCDWTWQRKDDITKQLVAKGVGANNQENLGQLINKISQVQTGGNFTRGRITDTDIPYVDKDTGRKTTQTLTIGNLSFQPEFIALYLWEIKMNYAGDSKKSSICDVQFFWNVRDGSPKGNLFRINQPGGGSMLTISPDVKKIDYGFTVNFEIAIVNRLGTYIPEQKLTFDWYAMD